MKKTERFMQAVQILAPDDHFTHQAGQPIPKEKLPFDPGGVALEFVVSVQKRREPINFQAEVITDQPTSTNNQLSIAHAIRIKSAEYWLKLGEADEALRELEKLPLRSWHHVWVLKTRIAAMGVLRAMNCQAHAE